MEDNIVMKTTEVAVRTEMAEPDAEEKYNSQGNSIAHRQRPSPSPTSSEVEFAGAGY
jgi:hypothetical protein